MLSFVNSGSSVGKPSYMINHPLKSYMAMKPGFCGCAYPSCMNPGVFGRPVGEWFWQNKYTRNTSDAYWKTGLLFRRR